MYLRIFNARHRINWKFASMFFLMLFGRCFFASLSSIFFEKDLVKTSFRHEMKWIYSRFVSHNIFGAKNFVECDKQKGNISQRHHQSQTRSQWECCCRWWWWILLRNIFDLALRWESKLIRLNCPFESNRDENQSCVNRTSAAERMQYSNPNQTKQMTKMKKWKVKT